MNKQDCVRCFTPEYMAKKWSRISPMLQIPRRSIKSMPLQESVEFGYWNVEKVLDLDF